MKSTAYIKIIYQDNHLLVVEKPPNILTQGDSSGDTDLLSLLKEDIKVRYKKPGRVFLGLVHRLDRPVGGVMVFARTSKAAARLSEQIRKREFGKFYLAVVNGVPGKAEGKLRHFLIKDSGTNTVKAVPPDIDGSKEAILEYNVKNTIDGLSLIETFLVTGRPHQIRVQFSEGGFPIYGDKKYGKKDQKGGHIALWSHKIQFIHPVTKDEVIFESNPGNNYPWNMFHSSL